MSQNLFATLRIAAIERNHKGSPESRDKCIEMYLDELGTLLSEDVMQEIDSASLIRGYEQWVSLAAGGKTQEERLAAMRRAIMFCPRPVSTDEQNPTQPSTTNVVSLFG